MKSLTFLYISSRSYFRGTLKLWCTLRPDCQHFGLVRSGHMYARIIVRQPWLYLIMGCNEAVFYSDIGLSQSRLLATLHTARSERIPFSYWNNPISSISDIEISQSSLQWLWLAKLSDTGRSQSILNLHHFGYWFELIMSRRIALSRMTTTMTWGRSIRLWLKLTSLRWGGAFSLSLSFFSINLPSPYTTSEKSILRLVH